MNNRLADSVAKILYEDTKTKLTKDNIKDSAARAAASILEAPIVSKKLDQSGPQKSAAEILFESIREKSQSQDSAARVAAQILKTSPATTQMIAESGSTISDALNFEPKIKTKDESIFYNKKRKEISEEVKHEIEALESKFETLENTLAEDLRKYKQNITEAVSTTKTNYAGTDSGGGEVRLLAMDDVETKMMNKQARVSYLANNVTLTYDTNDKLFHFRYAHNQNLLQSSNVIFNNIDTTGNINVGGTAFVNYDVTGNTNLIVTGNTNIGKNLIVSGNTILQGNLIVTGLTTTVNTSTLIITDALFHLNDTSTTSNVDLGFTGNYNDGTYRHAGLFRDSTDGVWKLFDGYTPETNTAVKILTSNASYVDAGLKVGTFTANGNVTVTITGNLSADNIVTGGKILGNYTFSQSGATSAYATKRVLQYNESTGVVTYSNTLDAVRPYITGYGAEIHVSPVALDDTGNGTIGDPVKTIARAQALAAQAFETTAAGQRNTIVLHPGDYVENVTISTQYTVLTTHELVGKNTTLSGTLTITKGCTIDGLKMTNLIISADNTTGTVDIIGCTVTTATTKTSSAYTVFRGCDLSSSTLSITGSGTTIMVGGNYFTLAVNNAAAGVLAKTVVTMGPVTLTAGTLQLSDTLIYAGANTANAITQSAGSVITVNNCQTLIPSLTSVARNSFGGFYSILTSVYDKANSTFGGTSLNSIVYSQYINADSVGVGLTPVTNNGVLQLGSYAAIKSLVESATITGAAPSATTQFDWMTQAVQYYTSNATTNFTLNIRGNGSTSLNTVMQVGQSASIALMVTNGSPAYYMSAINIDSTASGVTVKYINGTSLSSGNANSIDIYNITVIKTASATYTVLVVQTKFA
jgi:hypothetical protein